MTTPQIAPVEFDMVERRVGDLWVDPNVQRALRKARVETMAKKFDFAALGVLTTSYRSPKRIHIIDGQHRYRAAEAAGYKGAIQTMQYTGLSIPQEAALFRVLNETEKVSRIDRFQLACVEQDPDALALAGFVAAHGWTVGSGGGSNDSRLSAIGSLERVYALSPEAADETLAVLTKAFGYRISTVQGSLVEGLGRMLAKYGRAVDLNDLADRLSGVPGGPDGLVGNARGQALTRTGNLSNQVAKVVVDLYNTRRRTRKLPAWT